MFHTKYVDTLITPNKFHVPSFNCSLVIAMKSKGKFRVDNFNAPAVMWLADESMKEGRS
jgi:hypothetical protein